MTSSRHRHTDLSEVACARTRSSRVATWTFATLTTIVMSWCVVSTATAQSIGQLRQMSLEQLGDIEVTTTSKAPEEARLTPAALYVITNDEIRRSGATTLPELLRSVPGLDVARIDTTHWSVGVRGFGDQFSKSVLVLIDGRSVYTPLFAGVFWATQDYLIDDIERIEVVRGPGGTIWGANAVNGVINIVTKRADATIGTLAEATTGNTERVLGSVRHGARVTDRLAYRLYGKGFKREPQAHADGQDFDRWSGAQAGGRVDWQRDRNDVTLQGDVYSSNVGQSVSLAAFSPPSQTVYYDPFEASGGNLSLTWARSMRTDDRLRVQTYLDRTDLQGPQLGERRHTFDIDVNHRIRLGTRNTLAWGGGSRVSASDVTAMVETLDVTPHHQVATIASTFVEYVNRLSDNVSVTVGAKAERYTYTGLEFQPSTRLLWQVTDKSTVWLAATRAVRTPSRLERDLSLTGYLTSDPIPAFIRVVGSPTFDSERLHAYEGGYRQRVGDKLYLDVATFYNRHHDLESFGALDIFMEATPAPAHAVLQVPYANGVSGSSFGADVSSTWRHSAAWQLKGFYSYLRLRLGTDIAGQGDDAVTTYEGSSPRHQARLQSSFTARTWQWDQTVRFVSALPARDVARYTAVDLSLSRAVNDRARIALAAQNLFDRAHPEFGHDPGPTVEIRRSVAVTFTWTR